MIYTIIIKTILIAKYMFVGISAMIIYITKVKLDILYLIYINSVHWTVIFVYLMQMVSLILIY